MEAQMQGVTFFNSALANEKDITDFVAQQAKESGFDQAGIEHRIKSKESYLRKIRQNYLPARKHF